MRSRGSFLRHSLSLFLRRTTWLLNLELFPEWRRAGPSPGGSSPRSDCRRFLPRERTYGGDSIGSVMVFLDGFSCMCTYLLSLGAFRFIIPHEYALLLCTPVHVSAMRVFLSLITVKGSREVSRRTHIWEPWNRAHRTLSGEFISCWFPTVRRYFF